MFRLGQKVACVNDAYIDEAWNYFPYNRPKYGEVYTVRDILPDFFRGMLTAIRLYEIHNPVLAYSDGEATEIAFWVGRFRPVVTRKTDISCFEALLNTQRECVR